MDSSGWDRGSAWKRDLRSAVRPRRTRDLAADGITEGLLRGRGWRRVSRGFHAPDLGSTLTPGQRILDASVLLADGCALGGWAAAYVMGVDWLDGVDPHTFDDIPVDLIAPNLKRHSGPVAYRSSALPETDRRLRDGLTITSAPRTALDGSRWAPDLREAVVFLDSMLAFMIIRPGCFETYVAEHDAWTGIGQARRAAALSRAGVRSGWESRLRMCWLLDARLGEPMINVPIFDREQNLLGIADLLDPEAGLVAEYDGDQHRDAANHRGDNLREEKFESANLTVVRSDRVDIRSDRDQLAQRLRDGHRRGTLRDRSRDRWTLTRPDWWSDAEAPDYGEPELVELLGRVSSFAVGAS